jgi:hypothetical protein
MESNISYRSTSAANFQIVTNLHFLTGVKSRSYPINVAGKVEKWGPLRCIVTAAALLDPVWCPVFDTKTFRKLSVLPAPVFRWLSLWWQIFYYILIQCQAKSIKSKSYSTPYTCLQIVPVWNLLCVITTRYWNDPNAVSFLHSATVKRT